MPVPRNNQLLYKKLRWQARRGMLELDLVLEKFLQTQLDQLTDHEVELLKKLLTESDPVLYNWIYKITPLEKSEYQSLIDKMQKLA